MTIRSDVTCPGIPGWCPAWSMSGWPLQVAAQGRMQPSLSEPRLFALCARCCAGPRGAVRGQGCGTSGAAEAHHPIHCSGGCHLCPQGVNIMAFCKEYNSKTQDKMGSIIPVEITVFEVRCSLSHEQPTRQGHAAVSF